MTEIIILIDPNQYIFNISKPKLLVLIAIKNLMPRNNLLKSGHLTRLV